MQDNYPKLHDVNETDNEIVITGKDFEILFFKKTATIDSWIFQGKNILLRGPKPNFWRTPTDNDFGNKMPKRMSVWKHATDEAQVNDIKVDNYDTSVGIEVFYNFPSVESRG